MARRFARHPVCAQRRRRSHGTASFVEGFSYLRPHARVDLATGWDAIAQRQLAAGAGPSRIEGGMPLCSRRRRAGGWIWRRNAWEARWRIDSPRRRSASVAFDPRNWGIARTLNLRPSRSASACFPISRTSEDCVERWFSGQMPTALEFWERQTKQRLLCRENSATHFARWQRCRGSRERANLSARPR